MIDLPSNFVKTIKDIHKEKGEQWLANFENLICNCENRWKMKVLPPFDLSYHFVAPAITEDGSNIVIKLAVPNDEFYSEVEALKIYNGNGMVRLIDTDLEKGIILLERLMPGDTLASIENDEDAVFIAAQMMKKLWIPAPTSSIVQTILDREKSLSRICKHHPEGLGPITKETLQDAYTTFQELLRTQTDLYLTHGDLHHYNILKANEEWLAIDPKGLIGEREYDCIQFLLNNLENKDILSVIEKRIDILVEQLQLDKKRILLWGYSHAVLSTCWSLEDEGTYNQLFYEAITIFKQLYTKYYLE